MRFAHTNIVSIDWQALVNFYVSTFECRVIPPIRNQSGEWLDRGTGMRKADLEGAHLLLPGHGDSGPTLEIYQYHPVKDRPTPAVNQRGLGHLAFEVECVTTTLKSVLENGGSAEGEIVRKAVPDAGELTFVYARDPEGNLIELQSWKNP